MCCDAAMKHTAAPIWVVVADRSRARLFKHNHDNGGLTELEGLEFPDGRLQDHEIMSDAAGPSGGGHHSSYDARDTAKAHRRAEFAQVIGQRLEHERTAGELGGFYLIAEPRFLGELRATLSDPLVKQLRGEVPHHETQASSAELRKLLPTDL
jgi:protein required for attachment to host cells